MKNRLAVHKLAVSRGGRVVLADVDFTLALGQALIVRGPNGAGKTTLLRTLAGLQPPLAGRIEGAEDRIAYAGHADGIKANLSVAENLSFWAAIFGATQRRVAPALEAFDLTVLAARRAGTLSAGQKRRLGLARLLVTGRPVWLLDEPTVSLDRTAMACFARNVMAHLAAGGAALIATHVDLGLASATELDITAYRYRAHRRASGRDPQSPDEAFL